MNLNFSHQNEYILNNSLINEYLNIYGVQVRLVKTEKLNADKEVFGDWSSIKTNDKDTFDIMVVPEDMDNIQQQDYAFGEYGFNFNDVTAVFASAQKLMKYGFGINELVGCLIVFPSNKVMEITNADLNVPHINNLWGYSDGKSLFRLSLASYNFKLHDELDSAVVSEVEADDFGDLNNFTGTKVINEDATDEELESVLKDNESSSDNCNCNCKSSSSSTNSTTSTTADTEDGDYMDTKDLPLDILPLTEEEKAEIKATNVVDEVKNKIKHIESNTVDNTVDGYLSKLDKVKTDKQDYEAEVRPSASTVIVNDVEPGIDTKKLKPIIDITEKDVFDW